MKFTVLMAVYIKENPSFFKKAIESIWENQSIKPNEVIIVEDGPLTKELNIILNKYESIMPLKRIKLENNVGLGKALNIGVENCSNEYIFRMDSDDISFSNRFEKQLNFINNNPDVDFFSSHIAEFEDSISKISGKRIVPINREDFIIFSKSRNPINHMTAVFKKSAVLKVGNYISIIGYEDYYLWIRLLMNGFIGVNIDETLLFARAGRNMISRRQGFSFFKSEFFFLRKLRTANFISRFQFIKNMITRCVPRLFPVFLLNIVYKFLRK